MTCLRRSYSQSSALHMSETFGRTVFQCDYCGNWHTGRDPGPVAPCVMCGTLVTVPLRGLPADAARGWLHDTARCRAPVRV